MFKMLERLSFAVDLVPVELLCSVHGQVEYYHKGCYGHCSIGQ
jgi:hypothetical protein